ncbi:hypothetical protein GCM10023350_42320 [Nocardioides endophyticus]|uniref:Uncharacterized protein n=1 Tax=Nocardioides endophyticus TaxID=1353775 RepID=A0ABP8ZC00_9ACTN
MTPYLETIDSVDALDDLASLLYTSDTYALLLLAGAVQDLAVDADELTLRSLENDGKPSRTSLEDLATFIPFQVVLITLSDMI